MDLKQSIMWMSTCVWAEHMQTHTPVHHLTPMEEATEA